MLLCHVLQFIQLDNPNHKPNYKKKKKYPSSSLPLLLALPPLPSETESELGVRGATMLAACGGSDL